MTVDIICADAREALARFPDGHFHCCVTSPPYWSLRDYGLEPVPCRILDPFSGSGTVGVVAERLGRHSVLIDAKEEYCALARHRTAQMGLMTSGAAGF